MSKIIQIMPYPYESFRFIALTEDGKLYGYDGKQFKEICYNNNINN